MSGAGARRDPIGRRLASLPHPAQTLLRLAFVATRVTAGPRSFATYLRLSRIRRHVGSAGRVVRMRLRPLGGREVLVRPSTSDVDTVWGTFAGRYHLPPPEATEPRSEARVGPRREHRADDGRPRRAPSRRADRRSGARRRECRARARQRAALGPALRGHRGCGVARRRRDPLCAARRRHRGASRDRRAAGGRPGRDRVDRRVAMVLARARRPRCRSRFREDRCGGSRARAAHAQLALDRAACARSPSRCTSHTRSPTASSDLRELGFETRVDPRHWACVIGVRPS